MAENEGEKTLDLSNELPGEGQKGLVDVPWNSQKFEDQSRRTIAYMLIGLLTIIVSSMLILLSTHSIELSQLREFDVLLVPIVTLVSAATGFYYGSKNSK